MLTMISSCTILRRRVYVDSYMMPKFKNTFYFHWLIYNKCIIIIEKFLSLEVVLRYQKQILNLYTNI